jgi:riboflavin kinase/FMN adenylyltransferase
VPEREPMEIILGLNRIKRSLINPVVTLGNFDGVHLGHQKIFQRVKEEALRFHGESVVITFEPHPLKVLSPENCPPLLTPFRKKMIFIEETGIETILCIEFSLTFSMISPHEFVKNILIDSLKVRKIIVGYNYRFGRQHEGDIETLKTISQRFGVEVEMVEALRVDHMVVSSSKIRELIKEGEVENAAKLLGRDYLIVGKVIEGAKRGRTLGFPTANLEISDELYPKQGVYAVEVVWNGQILRGLANVGFNPTFLPSSGSQKGPFSLEVYILNFSREIYGEELQVSFKKRIRDEIRFDSPSQLIEQINNDVTWAKRNVFRIVK